MSRGQLLTLHLSIALSVLTGALFALFKYLFTTADPYAVANHPLQPYALDAHVLVSPVAVFALGWIFSDHIWPKFRNSQATRRKSGVMMLFLILPMVLSGYLLQVSVNEQLRRVMEVAHWVSSGFFTIGYCAHLFTGVANGVLRSDSGRETSNGWNRPESGKQADETIQPT